MIAILAEEEEDMKKGRSISIYVVTTPGDGGQKRKHPYNTASNEKKYVKKKNTGVKGNDKNMPPRMRAIRENATIFTSLDIRRQITRS